MEKWNNILFHSLHSEWYGGTGVENYMVTIALEQLTKLQLILESGYVYSFNNIDKYIDMNRANEIYKGLFNKYCDASSLSFESEFNLNRNNVNHNGDEYISLIYKYIDNNVNDWFNHFCLGHDRKLNPWINEYSIYGVHPYRITVNLMFNDEILKQREHRLCNLENIKGEVQVLDDIPINYLKGIAIGTQQNSDKISENLKKIYYKDYCRRLNLIYHEVKQILKDNSINLPIYDVITEEIFEIDKDKQMVIEEVMTKKFTDNPSKYK